MPDLTGEIALQALNASAILETIDDPNLLLADILAELQTLASDPATETTALAILAALGGTLTVNTGLTDLATQTTLAAVLAALQGTLSVDTGLFQPIQDGGTVIVQDGGLTLSVDDGAGSLSIDDGGSSITVDGVQTDALTNTQLRAAPVEVTGTVTATIGEVEITNDVGNPVPVSGVLTDAELRATPVPVSGTVSVTEPVTVDGTVTVNQGTPGADGWPVLLAQTVDANNTKVVAAADASPGSPWIGPWTATRDEGIVRLLTVLASSSAAVGGTFTFEFSETGAEVGLGTAPISETRPIGDFDTVRDFDLINAGAYYRVAFEPATALGAELVFVTTTQRRQNDGAFVRLANQEIEEANAAMGQTFVYPKAFLASTGKSINIRADELGSMYVVDERQVVTQSGSSFTESIRDDISISFDADEGALNISRKVEDEGGSSPSASISHDTTQGQVVISTGGVAGAVAYYQSQKRLVYEAGHELAGEQTIEVDTANLVGDAMVEWGLAISDGAGNTYNHIGFRLTAAGLFAVRKKNGVDQSVVAQADFNRDKMLGSAASRYRLAGEPVAINLANNSLWRIAFEWLGIAPPTYKVMVPAGVIVPVHVEETPGQQTGTTVPTPRLRLFVRVQQDSGSAPALTVRSGSWRGGIHTSKVVSTAAQPDGDYVDERADGLAQDRTGTNVEFTTPLGSGGIVVSDWVDTDGWNQLEILVTTDQVSASGGVEVEFTDDTSAITPTIRATQMFTYTATDVALGYATYPIPVTSDGFRIRYTNGGTAQGSFYLGVTLRKPSRPQVQRMQTGQIELTDPGSINWNRIYGYTDGGTFVAPGISDGGGQRIAITEHEVTTPPAASSAMGVYAGTATTTPSVALSSGSALTGRTGVLLMNRDGTKELRYATSTASISGGVYAAVPPGSGVILPIDESLDVAVAAATGSVAWSITEVAELQAAIP